MENHNTRKIFTKGKNPLTSAHFGWQDQVSALWGIKEGYKNAADNLVDIALEKGSIGDRKTLDTYIFPAIFLYRHSLEISLKLIYQRYYGKLPQGGHKLAHLWGKVYDDVIKDINNEEFLEQVKQYKQNFIKYSTDRIDFNELKSNFEEIQNVDKESDVWRYLLKKDGNLYFTSSESIDYLNLKIVMGELFEVLGFFYHIVSEYLSS